MKCTNKPPATNLIEIQHQADKPLSASFFDKDACTVAKTLLGKVIRRYYQGQWLSAQIIETEAYYIHDKGSHASLGQTKSREALFMPSGTLYLYYARGKPSLNVSCQGRGNAVLIKSGYPFLDAGVSEESLRVMQRLNLHPSTQSVRPLHQLCAGQTLLCAALALTVEQWDKTPCFQPEFYFTKIDYVPEQILQTTRLGIPIGRDEHLPYRFVDAAYAKYCSSNPLTKRQANYTVLSY